MNGRDAVRSLREIKDKKRNTCAEQVGHKHRERDAAERRLGELGHDQPRAEAALVAAEEALDLDAVDVVPPSGAFGLAPLLLVRRRPAGLAPRHLHATLLAVFAVLLRPVDLVDEGALRIVPGPLLVALQHVLEHRALVVGVERDLLQPRVAPLVHAHVVLRAELDRRLRLAAHDRTKVRLRDADDAVRDPVLPLVEHLPLLRVELADRVEVPDVALVHEDQAFRKIGVDKVHVALHRAQHDADERAHLLRGALLRLGHGKVLLPENPAVRARPARLVGHRVELVDHPVQLLARLVEEREVLRIAYVRGRAGGVEDHRAEVSACRRLLLPLAGMLRRGLGLLQDRLVDRDEEVHPEALAQLGQHAVLERAPRLVGRHPDEVLVVGVAADLLDELAVAEPHPQLYDERPERHPRAQRGTAPLRREELHVHLLNGVPVHAPGDDHPLVVDVELHAAGLVEVLEGHLDGLFCLVHAFSPAKCGDFGASPRISLHIVYHFQTRSASDY